MKGALERVCPVLPPPGKAQSLAEAHSMWQHVCRTRTQCHWVPLPVQFLRPGRESCTQPREAGVLLVVEYELAPNSSKRLLGLFPQPYNGYEAFFPTS